MLSLRVASLVCVIAVVGCSRRAPTATESSTASAAASAKAPDDCEHLFEPPAGAELLCDEHTMGTNAEIHWQSYATNESRTDLDTRYRQSAQRCGVELETQPELTLTKGTTKLSTHDATPVDYPSCDKKPGVSQPTVILISTMLKR